MIDYKQLAPEDLWYLVGLITTDGCLVDGRHVNVTSKDCLFLRKLKSRMKISNAISRKRRGDSDGYAHNQWYYQLQICSVKFNQFLERLGLERRKSLTLKSVLVPKRYFRDFLRGVIDGDGSIFSWLHNQNQRRQWSLRVTSGSRCFVNWLNKETTKLLRTLGRLHEVTDYRRGNSLYVLKWGEMSAKRILQACYYRYAFCMGWKYRQAIQCMQAPQGWQQSKTLL